MLLCLNARNTGVTIISTWPAEPWATIECEIHLNRSTETCDERYKRQKNNPMFTKMNPIRSLKSKYFLFLGAYDYKKCAFIYCIIFMTDFQLQQGILSCELSPALVSTLPVFLNSFTTLYRHNCYRNVNEVVSLCKIDELKRDAIMWQVDLL